MDLERTKDKITSVAEAMQSSLETFYKQGSITKETKDNLIKETKKIKQLFIVRLDLANMDKQEKPSDKDSPLGYQEKVANLLQDLSLDNEQKERIKKLMDKLEEAKTISQVEDVLEAINQELDVLTKKDNTKDLEKIKELIRQAAEEKRCLLLRKIAMTYGKRLKI